MNKAIFIVGELITITITIRRSEDRTIVCVGARQINSSNRFDRTHRTHIINYIKCVVYLFLFCYLSREFTNGFWAVASRLSYISRTSNRIEYNIQITTDNVSFIAISIYDMHIHIKMKKKKNEFLKLKLKRTLWISQFLLSFSKTMRWITMIMFLNQFRKEKFEMDSERSRNIERNFWGPIEGASLITNKITYYNSRI